MDPAYISIPEFSRVFGIGRTTTYRMLARKNLRAIKVGDRTLLDVAKAREYFASQPEATFTPEAA